MLENEWGVTSQLQLERAVDCAETEFWVRSHRLSVVQPAGTSTDHEMTRRALKNGQQSNTWRLSDSLRVLCGDPKVKLLIDEKQPGA
jgi:hypothetical protein